MPLLLNALYLLLLAVASPVLLHRAWRLGKYREGWSAKFRGKVPRLSGDRPRIWFHAVSVGEVKLLGPLVRDLARRRPDWDIVISSTTPTGLDLAKDNFPDLVTFYAPLDFSWAAREAMARIRPTVLALVELELWPNLIAAAKDTGARVAIVNGRLSARSFRGYRRIRPLITPTLRRLDLVAASTDEYAARFEALGVPAGRIRVTGSVKYDGIEADRGNARTVALRRTLGLSAADLVFVAGSTMEGEEAAALDAFRAARAENPRLRLVLVPRHKERFDEVAHWLERQGEPLARRSRLGDAPAKDVPAVVLVDTIGELSAVWGLADVAFVGGSLLPGRGGQNMMEPAGFGAAVLFGPHTQNFREAVEGLLGCGGALRVESPAGLSAALLDALRDPEAAGVRGAAARAFVLAQQGASARTASELDRLAPYPALRLAPALSR